MPRRDLLQKCLIFEMALEVPLIRALLATKTEDILCRQAFISSGTR